MFPKKSILKANSVEILLVMKDYEILNIAIYHRFTDVGDDNPYHWASKWRNQLRAVLRVG